MERGREGRMGGWLKGRDGDAGYYIGREGWREGGREGWMEGREVSYN